MEKEKLTFEEAIINRLDVLEEELSEQLEIISGSLERIADALEELNP